MPTAAASTTTSKLAAAMEALLHTIAPTAKDGGSSSSGGGAAVALALAVGGCSLLLLLLLLPRSSNKRNTQPQAAGGGGGKPPRPMPTLPGYPLIGSTLEVLANMPRFLDFLLEKTKDPALGGSDGLGTWGFNVALQPPFVVMHDPECVRHVLTQVDRYGKGPVWRSNFWPILGDGIFSADGQNWLVQRKRAANMFKVANFKHSMLEAVRGKLQRFMTLLDAKVTADQATNPPVPVPASKTEEKGGEEDDNDTGSDNNKKAKGEGSSNGASGAVVEMQDLFFKLTLDTIGEIAFGRDLGSLSGKNMEFMRAFDFCQQYANDLFFKPGPGWLWALLSPAGWENTRRARILSQYGRKLVTEMIQAAAAEEEQEDESDAAAAAAAEAVAAAVLGGEGAGAKPTKKETILSFFLAKETKASLQDARTVKYLTDVIMNFQIAGRDTVAQALSWAVHLLVLHPDVQQKLRAEARSVLGPLAQAQSAATTYEKIMRLEYGYAVATEVLRLYPSVPKEGKWAYQDDVLPDGTRVRARSWIIFAPYVMGRLESLWSEPGAFKPERHLGKPKPSSFIFTAFQGGPRICLGQNLAYMQLQYTLALLVLAFEIEAVDGGAGVAPNHQSATLPMRDGVRVRLTRRAAE